METLASGEAVVTTCCCPSARWYSWKEQQDPTPCKARCNRYGKGCKFTGRHNSQ